MKSKNVEFILFIPIIFLMSSGFGQTTTIDFETENSGYSASGTEGSGFTDVFNRSNPNLGGNSSYIWSCEDLNTLTNPSINLTQISVTGATSFTFAVDMIAHHYMIGTLQMKY